jgi:hypothetical protein
MSKKIEYKWKNQEWKSLKEYPLWQIDYELDKLKRLYPGYEFRIEGQKTLVPKIKLSYPLI